MFYWRCFDYQQQKRSFECFIFYFSHRTCNSTPFDLISKLLLCDSTEFFSILFSNYTFSSTIFRPLFVQVFNRLHSSVFSPALSNRQNTVRDFENTRTLQIIRIKKKQKNSCNFLRWSLTSAVFFKYFRFFQITILFSRATEMRR